MGLFVFSSSLKPHSALRFGCNRQLARLSSRRSTALVSAGLPACKLTFSHKPILQQGKSGQRYGEGNGKLLYYFLIDKVVAHNLIVTSITISEDRDH
jgi:hypothetical protein